MIPFIWFCYFEQVKHRLRDNSYEEEEAELMAYLQPRTQEMMVGLRNRPLAVLKLLSDHVAWLVESGKVAIQV
jgi:predicted membrane chloride channel (bestrophin family)